MPPFARHFIVALVGCSMPATVAAQSPAPLDDATLARRIDAYLAPLAERELSGTLLVARGDRVVLERSFGFANHELRVPFVPATPTSIASITKPLTVIIASRLIDARRIAPSDTVARWLPEYVHGQRMTIAHLMGHRAGVPHRLLADDAQEEPRTADEMVLAANAMPLLFEPGARESYSSGGYSILAAVLERASGRTYDALLQEHVATPVSARMLRHVNRRDLLPGRATSVIPIGDGVVNTPLRDLSFLVGAGSVYATPRDLFGVMQGVRRDVYGSTARAALVRTTGMSWNGVTNGFRAFAVWVPADSLTLIYVGNSHTGGIDVMRRDIPRIARGEPVPPATVPGVRVVALSAATRARLEGAYDTGGGSTARARFLSPRLMLFGDRALLATTDSTFFSTADYAPVTFTGNATRPVEAIQWGPGTWGTGEMGPRFPRVPQR